jgi:hypothetical protein
MVRMSDLVRGKGRGATPPPPPPEDASAPPAPPDQDPPERPAESPKRAAAAPPGQRPSAERLGGLLRAAAGGRRPKDAGTDPSPGAEAAAGAEQLFTELLRSIAGLRAHADTRAAFPWGPLQQLVERSLQSLEASVELFWVANRPSVPPDVDYLAFHQARVAVLALRLGANLARPREELIAVGLAGCVMDVGLWQLPAGALRRLDALPAKEQAQYHAHPQLAAELVRRWSPPVPEIVEMVLQHHEREQGQGFPQGLPGTAIHPGAKILGLVDTYTGLTVPASLKPGLPTHDAIRELVRSKQEAFPAALIKALLSEISVFPPGTLVRLNTGEVGRVIAVNRNHPLRPRVEVYDAKGRQLATPKVIDLSEAPFVYITGPVSEGSR